MTGFSRRRFLQAGSGAAVASLVSARHVVLAQKKSATPQASSGDRVRFASIGVGIQGSSLLRAAVMLPQADCVAACDVYDGRHTLAREIAGPNIKTTRRYQEILDDKNIQCVIVAVPDHWHKHITVDALSAGKDVYVEKPMSHSIAEGEEMVRAVQQSKNFVQVGSQRVSSLLFGKAKELYEGGAIGELTQVELQLGRNTPSGAWQYPWPPDLSLQTLDWDTWLGDAPKQAFAPETFARWRRLREFGTGMAGDLMVHLLSGMQFATGINAIPSSAYSVGGIFRWKDGRDTPDLQVTVFQYGHIPVTVRLTQETETPEVTRLMGFKGVIELSNSAVTYIPQSGLDTSPNYGLNGFPTAMRAAYEKQWHAEHDAEIAKYALPDVSVWHGPSWDDLKPHLTNFFEAVRSRQPVVEDVVFGHHAAAACHMANASYFEGKLITA
jgi:predicted dehydrogenase